MQCTPRLRAEFAGLRLPKYLVARGRNTSELVAIGVQE